MTERRQGLLCALGVLLIWTGFLLFSRLSAAQSLTSWDVAALRYAGAFLLILPLLARRGWPLLPPWRAMALTATGAFGFALCAYAGFGYAPAAHAAVLQPGLLPFLAAATWWFAFNEPWGRRRTVSLVLVAAGMALLASDTFGSHPGAWRGDLLFIAACSCWTGYMYLIRRWRVPAFEATGVLAILAAPIYLPVWWVALPSTMGAASPGVVAFQLAYQGFAMVVAGLLFTQAVVKLGAPLTSTITALTPVLVVLGAWPLLGEALGAAGAAGVGLVTLGIAAGALTLPGVAPTSRA